MTFHVRVEGALVGRNWYGHECQKFIEEKILRGYASKVTLLDFVNRTVSDGDFQGCKFTCDTRITIVKTKYKGRSKVQVSKTYEVSEFPSLKQYISSKETFYA